MSLCDWSSDVCSSDLEVVQGAVSLAQSGRGGDRAVHEVERVLHGALERAAERQPCGDGGGERAAGAVRRSEERRVGKEWRQRWWAEASQESPKKQAQV